MGQLLTGATRTKVTHGSSYRMFQSSPVIADGRNGSRVSGGGYGGKSPLCADSCANLVPYAGAIIEDLIFLYELKSYSLREPAGAKPFVWGSRAMITALMGLQNQWRGRRRIPVPRSRAIPRAYKNAGCLDQD